MMGLKPAQTGLQSRRCRFLAAIFASSLSQLSLPATAQPKGTSDLRTLGATLDGSLADAARIQSIYNAIEPDAVLTVPFGGRLPASGLGAIVHPGGPIEWNLVGANYVGPTGRMPTSYALGDGDLTFGFGGGRLNVMRRFQAPPQDPTKPNLLVQLDNQAEIPLATYGLYPQIDAFRAIAQAHPGSSASMDAGRFVLNDLSTAGYRSQNVAVQIDVNRRAHGDITQQSGDWGLDVFFDDNTGMPPGAFSAIGQEFDFQANGDDQAGTDFDPTKGNRVVTWVSPGAFKANSWAANTSYPTGAIVQAISVRGRRNVYVASAGGISADAVPVWRETGTVKDGTVTWRYGTNYAMEIGRGIWLNNGEDTTTSYGTGFSTNGQFHNAVIDTSAATLLDPGSAALRVGPGQPIDFTGNRTSEGQNRHVLRYLGAPDWSPSTDYIFGQMILGDSPAGRKILFQATTAGKSAVRPPAWTEAGIVEDGSVRWRPLGPAYSMLAYQTPNGNALTIEDSGNLWSLGSITTGPNKNITAGGTIRAINGLEANGAVNFHGPVRADKDLDVLGTAVIRGRLISALATPSSSSSPCTSGEQSADANYVYVCVATNTWRRAALHSF
jgi:hypothetical protein